MMGPDQPAEMSLHRSKETLDYEGFFIAQPNPEFNGNTGSVPHSEVIRQHTRTANPEWKGWRVELTLIWPILLNLLYWSLPSVLSWESEREKRKEREKLIQELQEALAKVKTLSGFLPICMSCKKICDDKGYWEQVGVYIRDHSEAEFSHGICPDCMKKLYPDEI